MHSLSLLFKIATKPISRVLSWTTIFLVCTLPCSSSHLLETAGPTYMFLHDVAPNRVYMAAQSPARRCALTAPFHPYLQCRRYISVALSLGSPPAAVSRYSCPMEPGLSSGEAFRLSSAAVQLARKRYFTIFLTECQMLMLIKALQHLIFLRPP